MSLLTKTIRVVCGVAVVGMLFSGEALAAEKGKRAKATKTSAKLACCKSESKAVGFEDVTLSTGTHFKEKAKKRGEITTGRNSVVVIDQDAMRRRGAATLRDVLLSYPTTR